MKNLRLLVIPFVFFFVSFSYSQKEVSVTIDSQSEKFMKEWKLTLRKNGEQSKITFYVQRENRQKVLNVFHEDISVIFKDSYGIPVVLILSDEEKVLGKIIISESYQYDTSSEGYRVVERALEYRSYIEEECSIWKIRAHKVTKTQCIRGREIDL